MSMTHLSLFSGIGGLDLAAEWAGFETVGQCEWADFPYKVLCKHWPNVTKWRDIHELTAKSFREQTGLETVDCISGGFPCQPHSVAGKRLASCDERDLWPEMRRVIGEIKPGWVVAENVRGLLSSEDGRFFENILRDFSDMGYSVGWGVTSAAAVGAYHRRERMAIVAHADGIGLEGRVLEKGKKQKVSIPRGIEKPPAWTICKSWAENDMAESAVCGKHDGISFRMDRLKCLGNAVVPQQFYPVFKAICEIEKQRTAE